MKNLFGAAAPTNRVLGSFKFLVLIVLVAIGFTSCKDQSKSEVSPETELIAKANLQGVQSNFDIGGNGGQERRNFDIGGIGGGQTPPRRICEMYTTKEIGGGKSSNGGLEKTSDTGGRGNQGTTGEYAVSDIGGRGGKGTSSDTGQINSPDYWDDFDTGGRGASTNTGEYSFVDIGGRSTNSDTGGKNSNGGLEITSDIGGRGGVEPPGYIDQNFEPSTNKRFGCIRSPF